MTKFRFTFGLTLLLVILSLTPIGWFNGLLDPSQEQTLGLFLLKNKFYLEPNTNLPTSLTSQNEKALHLLVENFKSHNLELANLDIEVHILSSQELNFFALPGGILIITRGLLEKVKNLEELCGIVAHEIAHIQQHQTLKSLSVPIGWFLGNFLFRPFLKLFRGNEAENPTEFIKLNYSLDDEIEADLKSLDYLRKTKIDPKGMFRFYQRLNEQETNQNELSKFKNFLKTHPIDNSRLKRINTILETKPYAFDSQFPIQLQDLREDLQ